MKVSKEVACARLAQELAREVVSSARDPLQFHKKTGAFWIDADYPSTLQEVGTLDDEVNVSNYMHHTLSETHEMVRTSIIGVR